MLFKRSWAPTLLLLALTVAPAVATAQVPPVIAGFGNSITCTTCNDGSYLSLLDIFLEPAPIISDNGVSADLTDEVLVRLGLWLGSNVADVVIIMAGTPDTYKSVGGFKNSVYNEQVALDNVASMIDLVFAANTSVLLVAPPPVQFPCNNPPGTLTCPEIDTRLASLASGYGALATTKSVPFVDLYDIFSNDPSISAPIGDANSLYLTDGLHPKLATGDMLIAANIATALASIVPEPSIGWLLGSGLGALAAWRRRQRRA